MYWVKHALIFDNYDWFAIPLQNFQLPAGLLSIDSEERWFSCLLLLFSLILLNAMVIKPFYKCVSITANIIAYQLFIVYKSDFQILIN